MNKRIESIEQYNKAIEWMEDIAHHPLNPVVNDEKTGKVYYATELAVQDYNKRNMVTFPDDLEPEPVQEPEPIKEPTTAAKASWLDD